MQWPTTVARRGAVPLLVRRKMNGCSLFACSARSNRLCGNDASTVALLRRSFRPRQQPLFLLLRQSASNHRLRDSPLAIKLVGFGELYRLKISEAVRRYRWIGLWGAILGAAIC